MIMKRHSASSIRHPERKHFMSGAFTALNEKDCERVHSWSSGARAGGLRQRRGFTFVEMLITIAVFTVVMIAIVGSVLLFYRANSVALEQSYQVESARRGVELMVRDLREAAYADDGSFPLSSIEST